MEASTSVTSARLLMTRRRLGAATTALRAVEADRDLADVLNRVVEGIERERTEP